MIEFKSLYGFYRKEIKRLKQELNRAKATLKDAGVEVV